MNWSKSFRKTPHRCCGTPACAGRRCNARRPAPNPAGCPAWARSRQPRHWAWNAAGLVGNDPRHRRPCRRPSPASDRPPREQGTRERSSGAGRRTVGRTDWWDVLELGPGSEQKNSERGMVDWLIMIWVCWVLSVPPPAGGARSAPRPKSSELADAVHRKVSKNPGPVGQIESHHSW